MPENTPQLPSMPQLPDGIGLNLDDVIALLAAKNSTIVSKDDPILMLVTILNAFTEEENKLLDSHRTALASILTDKTSDYVESMKKITGDLSTQISSASVAEIGKIFKENHEAIKNLQSKLFWCALIIGASAIINVVVLIWKQNGL